MRRATWGVGTVVADLGQGQLEQLSPVGGRIGDAQGAVHVKTRPPLRSRLAIKCNSSSSTSRACTAVVESLTAGESARRAMSAMIRIANGGSG